MESVLERINKSSLKFLEPLTAQETYATIVEEASKLVSASSGYVLLAEKDVLKTVFASPVLPPFTARRAGYSYKAYKGRTSFFMSMKKIDKAHPEFLKTDIKYTVFIPLSYRKKSTGVLALHTNKRKPFTPAQLRALKLFGAMASMAIRKTQLYDEIKQALEVRDHFIALAAHELRTPLTSINGYIQLLQKKLGHDETEERWIKALHTESGRLTYLVQELLDINRVKAGQLQFNFEECSLMDIVEKAMVTLEKRYPKRKIIFTNNLKREKDSIIADWEKMLRVLLNILDNAAKFSPSDSKISVSIKLHKREFILTIRDEGVGVEKEHIDRIFQGFFKGNEEASRSGMGVGLLLAKYIIAEHNGTIQIRSKKNQGTSVQITLPALSHKTT